MYVSLESCKEKERPAGDGKFLFVVTYGRVITRRPSVDIICDNKAYGGGGGGVAGETLGVAGAGYSRDESLIAFVRVRGATSSQPTQTANQAINSAAVSNDFLW